MRVVRLLAIVGLGAVAACDSGQYLTDPAAPSLSAAGGNLQAKGEGVFLFDGGSLGLAPTAFDVKAKVKQDGTVSGQFRQTLTVQGSLIDVAGELTCLAVDQVNGRAWIGGVVTENNSEAFFTGEIHQPGRDVWFRVLDDDAGDRMTLPGFEGGGGIITSEEYCQVQPWPDANARTHPVIEGNIKVKP